ncbi:hypothetical protein D3C86_1660200 [compost metagenome]
MALRQKAVSMFVSLNAAGNDAQHQHPWPNAAAARFLRRAASCCRFSVAHDRTPFNGAALSAKGVSEKLAFAIVFVFQRNGKTL